MIFPTLTALVFGAGAVACLALARPSSGADRWRWWGVAGFGIMAVNSLLNVIPMIAIHQGMRATQVGVVSTALGVVHLVLLVVAVALLVVAIVTGRGARPGGHDPDRPI